MFVLRNLPQNESTNRETTHINAADLCWRMHDRAMVMFNATARAQMYKWGITSTKDIGHIVFELINEGLITRSDNHQQSEFENVFDFEQEFRALKSPSPIERWSLSGLFVVTTVVAIGLPGAIAGGVSGAIGTLFSAWFFVGGACCVWAGSRDRSQ